jgi:hypothetical protein
MCQRFRWTTYDVTDLLPGNWRSDVLAVAVDADFRDFPRTPPLTREAPDVSHVSRGRVHADQARLRLPWLDALYRSEFLELANHAWAPESVMTAADRRYGLVLNVQRGGTSDRFECHIDSNPLTGLLFLTDHQEGGEMAFARDPAAVGREAIDRDCSIIWPHAGYLAFFDARLHPHYTRPLASPSDIRVLAAMNFYTGSSPESQRPKALNTHLYGDPVLRICSYRCYSAYAGRGSPQVTFGLHP